MAVLKLTMSMTLLNILRPIFYHRNPEPNNLGWGLQNDHPYEPKKPKPNNSKFEVVFIISGKKRESMNERKRKGTKVANNKEVRKENEKYEGICKTEILD